MTNNSDFIELSKRINEAGLMKQQPLFMAATILITSSMLAFNIAIIVFVKIWWVQLLNAMIMAITFAQIGFIGHDIGHRQSFTGKKTNKIANLIFGNILLGFSAGWWNAKHSKHHANPNHEDMDPDIEIAMLAFTEKQALEKRGLSRAIVARQSWFFFPILPIQGFRLPFQGIKYLLENHSPLWRTEIALIMLHFTSYFALLLIFLPAWLAILVFLITHAAFGLYLSSVFAPNHKGMPVLSKETELDFVKKQVITARNVKPSWFTDWWYGGLNYQIEHHLFPTMSRGNYNKTQKIVQKFCKEKGIAYHETTMAHSYYEILSYLDQVSKVLRKAPRSKTTT